MIGIVTDSTSDLPADLANSLGIAVVPAYINIGSESYRDQIDIQRSEVYSKLPSMRGLPTTSAPAPGDFIKLFDLLLSQYEHIVAIHAATELTAIVNSASIAAQQLDAKRITVVDSGQISMGLGWQVIEAASQASKGASLEAVLNSIDVAKKRVKLFAAFNTMQYLARSGRVDIVRLGLSTLLDIKPLIELKTGHIDVVKRVRTWPKVKLSLIEAATEQGPFDALAVLHTNLEDQAMDLLDQFTKSGLAPQQKMIVSVTPVIGVHTGPGALGIRFIRKL